MCARVASQHFIDEYDPTIEDRCVCACREKKKNVFFSLRSPCRLLARSRRSYRKQVTIDEETCLLDILDTAGQEGAVFFFLFLFAFVWSHAPAPTNRVLGDARSIHAHGQGFLMVYSITSRSSFDEITSFREQILRVKDADKAPMVLVANKSDLENERQVTTGEGQDLAKSFAVPFMETSAKTRVNVEESFFELVREIRKDLGGRGGGKGGGGGGSNKGGAGGGSGGAKGGAAGAKKKKKGGQFKLSFVFVFCSAVFVFLMFVVVR